jgi:DNA repair protein RadC
VSRIDQETIMNLYVRSGSCYQPASRQQVLELAAAYQLDQFAAGALIRSPLDAKGLVASQLRGLESEHFGVLWLNARHKVIRWEVLFNGTIDGASVYPREAVRHALACNAAAAIFAHNHPSGDPEPSDSDRNITRRLHQALELIDVRVLDHLIVGSDVTSLSESGGW